MAQAWSRMELPFCLSARFIALLLEQFGVQDSSIDPAPAFSALDWWSSEGQRSASSLIKAVSRVAPVRRWGCWKGEGPEIWTILRQKGRRKCRGRELPRCQNVRERRAEGKLVTVMGDEDGCWLGCRRTARFRYFVERISKEINRTEKSDLNG